tara:strand:- start:1303 stop:1725 length:423 start_codon:yes stop_codon:yes gene_type:complete
VGKNLTTEVDNMDKEKNKQLIHVFWKNFSEKKYGEALSMLDESATWWVAGNTKLSGKYNKQDFSDLLSGVSGQAPNGIKVTPSSMTAEENRVSMEADSYAELTNGKTYKNEYHFLFTIKGNKIHTVKEYLDTEHVTEIFD